jgi:hypothetical protein
VGFTTVSSTEWSMKYIVNIYLHVSWEPCLFFQILTIVSKFHFNCSSLLLLLVYSYITLYQCLAILSCSVMLNIWLNVIQLLGNANIKIFW